MILYTILVCTACEYSMNSIRVYDLYYNAFAVTVFLVYFHWL